MSIQKDHGVLLLNPILGFPLFRITTWKLEARADKRFSIILQDNCIASCLMLKTIHVRDFLGEYKEKVQQFFVSFPVVILLDET